MEPNKPIPNQNPVPAQPGLNRPIPQTPVQPTPIQPISQPNQNIYSTEPVVSQGSGDIKLGGGKKKGGLIAMIIALVLVLGGGGAAAAYYYIRATRTPEVVMLSALSNFMKAEIVSATGGIEVRNLPDSGETDATFEFIGRKNLPTKSSLSAKYRDISQDLEYGFSSFVDTDGVFYVKSSGLDAFVRMNLGGDAPVDKIPGYEHMINSVDEQWIKISVPDIVNEYLGEDGDLSKKIKGVHACIFDNIKSINEDDMTALTELYENHQFLIAEKYEGEVFEASKGSTIYTVKLDEERFDNFILGQKKLPSTTRLLNCLTGHLGDDFLSKELDEEDEDDSIEDSEKTPPIIYVEINRRDQITRVYFETTLRLEERIRIDFKLTYPESAEITAPGSTKSIKDILDALSEFVPMPTDMDDFEI